MRHIYYNIETFSLMLDTFIQR